MRAEVLLEYICTYKGSLKDRARFKEEMKIWFSSDERACQVFFSLVIHLVISKTSEAWTWIFALRNNFWNWYCVQKKDPNLFWRLENPSRTMNFIFVKLSRSPNKNKFSFFSKIYFPGLSAIFSFKYRDNLRVLEWIWKILANDWVDEMWSPNRIERDWNESCERMELTIHSERHPFANRWRHVVAGDAEIRPHLPPLDTVEMQQRTVVVIVLLESTTTCVHGRNILPSCPGKPSIPRSRPLSSVRFKQRARNNKSSITSNYDYSISRLRSDAKRCGKFGQIGNVSGSDVDLTGELEETTKTERRMLKL